MTHGHGRRNGHYRKPIVCPACGEALAYVRPEMVILRRLIINVDKCRHEPIPGGFRLTCCKCNRSVTVPWATLQL